MEKILVCEVPKAKAKVKAKAKANPRGNPNRNPNSNPRLTQGYDAQSSLHKGVRVLNPSKLGFTEHSPTAEI